MKKLLLLCLILVSINARYLTDVEKTELKLEFSNAMIHYNWDISNHSRGYYYRRTKAPTLLIINHTGRDYNNYRYNNEYVANDRYVQKIHTYNNVNFFLNDKHNVRKIWKNGKPIFIITNK